MSGSSLPGLPSKGAAPKAAAPLQEEDGARLVDEVAGSWGKRFMHTIRRVGLHEGAYHYECLFSRPVNDAPVPGMVVSVRFALLQGGSRPRLFYSFEEGDLRLEWDLQLDDRGTWRAAKGQQALSLKHGVFENYLDSHVREKLATKERGIRLVTPFEETRLRPPKEAPLLQSGQGVQQSTPDVDPAACPAASDGGGSTKDSADALARGRRSSEASPKASKETAEVACAAPVTIMVKTPTGGDAPAVAPAEGEREEEGSVVAAMWNSLIQSGLTWDKVTQPDSLKELLANMFDAADEDGTGCLSHYEVARVLDATLPGFGLEQWDIYALMASARESEDGFIECQPFIEVAPDVMVGLRERRLAYKGRGMPGVEVTIEAVRHCFGEEILGTTDSLRKQFEECCQEDPSRGIWEEEEAAVGAPAKDPAAATAARKSSSDDLSLPPNLAENNPHHGSVLGAGGQTLVGMKRRHCRECLRQLPERLSPQEAQRIMEMLPEDEDGNVMFTSLDERLEHLRTEAISNGVVETDLRALRVHLVECFRPLLDEDNPSKMKVWDVKTALLSADQVCLSRIQLHVLLCLADPDPTTGDVDVAEFLGLCSVVIPHMCDAKVFMATAERLILEHEENRRRSENAELLALGAARVAAIGQDGEEKSQENEVDQETVERNLIQVLQFHDNTHRHTPALAPSDIFDVLYSNDTQVEGCQLSYFELNGLAAEMTPNADDEVPYVELIKRWVPIIFEVRKSPLFEAYLKEDAAGTLGIAVPNLQALEEIMPLLSAEMRESFASKKAVATGELLTNSADASAPSSRSVSRVASKAKADLGPPEPFEAVATASVTKLTSFRRAQGRQASKAGLKSTDMRSPRGKVVEPPPGRGYERRKQLLSFKREAGNRTDSLEQGGPEP